MTYYIREAFGAERTVVENTINTEIAAGAKFVQAWVTQAGLVQMLFTRKAK